MFIVFKLGDVLKLNQEGMNDLKYDSILGGILFGIFMWLMLISWVGVSLQDWVTLTCHQQSHLSENIHVAHVTTCLSEFLSEFFLCTTCIRKREKNNALHSALL